MPKQVQVLSTRTIEKVVRSIITNQLSLDFNEEIKFTPFYKHNLKKVLNLGLVELRKAERSDYDDFLDTIPDPDSVDYLFNKQFEMIKVIAKLEVPQYSDFTEVTKAFIENPKSVIGIAKKINKNKK